MHFSWTTIIRFPLSLHDNVNQRERETQRAKNVPQIRKESIRTLEADCECVQNGDENECANEK